MHVPAGGGRNRSRAVVVTSASRHCAGAAGRASAGTAGRTGPVVRRRRTAQLELAVLLDRTEYVGDGERCRMRGVMVVMMMVMRLGTQRHR